MPKLSEVASVNGELIPAGVKFAAKATAISAKVTDPKDGDPTSGGKHYLSVSFRVIDGDYEGIDITKTFWLGLTRSAKNGKLYGESVKELQAMCDAIGLPLPAETEFPLKGDETAADMKRIGQLLFDRINPNRTPRITFESVAKRQQAKNDAGKWVDAFDDEGKPKFRTEYYVRGTGAPAAAIGSSVGVGGLVGGVMGAVTQPAASTAADPLAFT
jgi:hypothetical protein